MPDLIAALATARRWDAEEHNPPTAAALNLARSLRAVCGQPCHYCKAPRNGDRAGDMRCPNHEAVPCGADGCGFWICFTCWHEANFGNRDTPIQALPEQR